MPASGNRQSHGLRASRGRGLRAKTGCLTCRKRHLKCDEVRPICNVCARSDKTCVYALGNQEPVAPATAASGDHINSVSNVGLQDSPQTSPDLLHGEQIVSVQRPDLQYLTSQPRRHSSSPAPGDGPNEQEPSQWQRATSQPSAQAFARQITQCESGMSIEQRSVVESPASHHNVSQSRIYNLGTTHPSAGQDDPSGVTYTSPTSIATASDHPIGIATARWFGMLADDADISMEANHQLGTPIGQESYRPAVVDIGEIVSGDQLASDLGPSVESAAGVTHTEQRLPPFGVEQLSSAEEGLWQSQDTLSMKSDETALFQTFVTHISTWMDLFDPHAHFASLVPRLALYNTGLLNAILALSVRHDSLSLRPNYARDDALQYYHQSLQYVRRAMQYTSYHTSLELLATTLIISAYEMLDGSSRDWERHLQGVFWIQRSQRIHGDSDGLRAAVWWAWLCQDTWAAFRDRRKVFTFWKPERTLAQLSTAELASRSVFILGRVINFCEQSETDDSASGILAKLETAKRLSAMLDEWESLLTPAFLPLPHNHQNPNSVFEPVWIHPPMYAVSIQVYHTSRILVLLNQPSLGGIDKGLQRQSNLDKHVDVICGVALMLTDYASSTMSSQCLFIAGLCTHDRQRRNEILNMLGSCREKTGWPVVPLQDELQKHWHASSGT